MAFPQGIDFRATSTYVTDPADCDFQLSTSSGGSYPRTTAQGNTVGWESAQTNTRDRNASNDPRLAGIHFVSNTASALRYRIDLPSTGDYKFRCAAGDASSQNGVYVEVFDTTTSLGTLVTAATVSAGHFVDATDVERTSNADWVANNALSAALTFSSTICRFKVSAASPAGNFAIAHLWVEAAAGGGSTDYAATGAPAAQSSTIAGAATVGRAATGALAGQASTLSGAVTVNRAATGSLSAQAATVSGDGTLANAFEATGDLSSQAAAVAGSVAINRAAVGALSAQSARITTPQESRGYSYVFAQ